MRKSFLLKLLMLAVCAAMLLSLFACNGDPVETEPTTDEQTEGKTDPAETDPTESTPAESEPTESKPAESKPAESDPAESKPAESKPAESDPAESKPAESDPAESKPAETDPVEPECGYEHELKAKGDQGHYTDACADCGAERSELADHNYETVEGKPTCKDCGHVASCNGEHAYVTDAENHWKAFCSACKYEGEAEAPHTPVYADGKYACTVCGYEYTCPTNGVHELVNAGEAGHHTAACPICNAAEGENVPHVYEGADRICACGNQAECKGVHEITKDADGHAFAACDICGAAATEKVPHSEEKVEFVDGNVYSYGCKDCGYGDITRTLEDSVKVFFSPYMISYTSLNHPTNPRTHFQFGTKAFAVDSDEAYFGFAGADKALQFIWNRGPGVNGYKEGNDQDYTVDIGNANYLVIKMRASETNLAKNFGITYSTTGVDGSKYVVLPVASATANKWETYVIDLSKAYNGQHVLDAESGTYKVDTFYYHCDGLASTTKIDIAYMAFVEGDWTDIGALVDEETVIAVTASNAGVKVNKTTGECVDEHAYAVQSADGVCKNICAVCGHDGGVAEHNYTATVVDGEYKAVCACGDVKATYGVKAEGPNKIWTPDIIKSTGGLTGTMDKTVMYDVDGTPFVRLDNFWPNRDNWGDFSINVGAGIGNGTVTGRYLVMKIRVGAAGNGTNYIQVFANTNKGGANGLVGQAEVVIAKSNDNQWHTIIIDLAQRVKDPSKAFVDEGDGTYNVRYFAIRPFGGASTVTSDDADGRYFYSYWAEGKYKEQVNGKENRLTAEEMAAKGYDQEKIHKCNAAADMYVDFSYVALFDSLDDIPNVVTSDTYEWSVDGSTNAERYTADNSCVTHAISEKVEGTTHTIACAMCDYVVKTYEIPASINYYADLSIMTHYGSTLTKSIFDEKAILFYNNFTAKGGCHFDLTGGSVGTAGSWTTDKYNSGKYVVIKYRSTVNENLYVGTQDRGTIEGQTNPLRASVGTLYASADWKVQIFEIPDNCTSYTVNSEQQLYFMVGSSAGSFDVAYLAVTDDVDEAILLLSEGETFYLGTKHFDQNMQFIPCEGGCKYSPSGSTFVCSGCGATIEGTIHRNSTALGEYTNYSIHNNPGAAGKATTGQTDSATGYAYSRMQANPESTSATIQGRNFLGGNAASGINYLIFRYRVGENGLGQENIVLYFNVLDEAHSLRINVEEDNTWHTVVVDLKACVGDGTVYDGSYTNAFFRPFGDLTGDTVRSNADAYVDFAYSTGCGSLDDAVKILGTDTYEWLNGTTVEVRDSATHEVVTE